MRSGNDKYTKEKALQDLKDLDEEIDKLRTDAKDELHEEVQDAREEIGLVDFIDAPKDIKKRKELWRNTLNTNNIEGIDWCIENKNNERGGYDYYFVFYDYGKDKWALTKTETPYISTYDGEYLSIANNPVEFLDIISKQTKPEYMRVTLKGRELNEQQTETQETTEEQVPDEFKHVLYAQYVTGYGY